MEIKELVKDLRNINVLLGYISSDLFKKEAGFHTFDPQFKPLVDGTHTLIENVINDLLKVNAIKEVA